MVKLKGIWKPITDEKPQRFKENLGKNVANRFALQMAKQKRTESIYTARKKAVYMKHFFLSSAFWKISVFAFHLFLVCIIIVVGVRSFDPDLSVRHYNNVWNTWQHTPRINWKIKLVYRRIFFLFLSRSPLFLVRWIFFCLFGVCVFVNLIDVIITS